MEHFLFYLVSAVALLSAGYFVFARNPLYAVLSLIVTFFSIAGFYFLLNAQFLGIVQIIVYAGAIIVLFLYILMMLNLNKVDEARKNAVNKFAGIFAAVILLIGMLSAYRSLYGNAYAVKGHDDVGLTENLGKLLFNQYVMPFELASILILAGIVGAVLVGKKDL